MGKRDMTVAARTPANPRDERTLSDDVGAAPTLRGERNRRLATSLDGFPKCDACVRYGFENRSFSFVVYIMLHACTYRRIYERRIRSLPQPMYTVLTRTVKAAAAASELCAREKDSERERE